MKPLGVLLLPLLLVGCTSGGGENAEPCETYEAAYNDGQAVVAGDAEPAEVRATLQALTTRIADAAAQARGDVATELNRSATLWEEAMSGSDDAGVAFFLQAKDVADACAASGSPIRLLS